MKPDLPNKPGEPPPLIPIDPDEPGPPSYDDPPPPQFSDEPPQAPMALQLGAVNAEIRNFRISHPANHFGKMQESHSAYYPGQHIQRVVFSVALGIVATGCYGGIAVEPRHEPRSEERSEEHHEHQREEQREEPHEEHHESHHDDEHRD